MQLGQQFNPIKRSELPMHLETAQATSQTVTPDEFQAAATRGQAHLDRMRSTTNDISMLHDNYGDVTKGAYDATREEWGGQTINPRTAKAVNFHEPDKHVMSAREPGQDTISVNASASREHFSQAMATAKDTFGKQLTHSQHYLGVFHDADKGQVEIDPVVVVGDPSGKHREDVGRAKAQDIMAATHATGGAYHFASGNGVFPPHVSDESGPSVPRA